MNEQTYIILDSKSTPLAKGILLSQPGSPSIQIRVLEDQAKEIAGHEVVQLVGMSADGVSVRCRILWQRNDRLVLERMEVLNPELRRNLRIPVAFHSYLYPLDGKRGRWAIESIDISGGGLAFYADQGLVTGQRAEVVIPINTIQPLILQLEILKVQELKSEKAFYAAKFVNMCRDEENAAFQAVFSVQLQSRSRKAR